MQLVLSLSPGGTQRLAIEICKRLNARFDFMVCCLDERGDWAAELEPWNIPVVALGRRPGFRPLLAASVARLISSHQVDVIHCHHYSPYIYGSIARMLRPARLVFTEHGRISETPLPKRQLLNPFMALLPGPICAVSSDLKRHMVSEGFPAHRVRVVYNGVDYGSRPTYAQREAARRALGISDQAFVIGTAGRLNPVKNLTLMLHAHRLLRQTVPQAVAVIVGDGEELGVLRATADELGVDGSVIFTGYRSDVRALLPALDVYLNCSKYEGVSLAILEGMGASLPVVATLVGGNPEVVIDRETGYLVPPSPRAIAEVMTRLASAATLRQALGDAARERALRHFSIARMVDEYASLYLADRKSAIDEAPMTVPAAGGHVGQRTDAVA
jgi:glycosyltransferase involved in cell wall biosynthesis